MQNNFTYVLIILVILIFGLGYLTYIDRLTTQIDPNSCLAANTHYLQSGKANYAANVSSLPHCDLFGGWRPQQNDESGNSWCVDKKGKKIRGSEAPAGEQPAQCAYNQFFKIWVKLTDKYL